MSRPKKPHILLITTDQQRYDALGINGNPVLETPNLDNMAASGVNFSRCYTTCPVCIPARRTLLSGQHPVTHGLRGYKDGLDWDPPFTLPGILRDAGYQTQLAGKLHLHPMGKRYGFDHMMLSETSNWRPTSALQARNDYVRWLRCQGVDAHPHFHGINGNGRLVAPWPLEDRLHHNNWLAREAVQFLCEDRDPSSPFFLHLSFFHPHPPLVPTRDYLERYLCKEMPGPVLGDWSKEIREHGHAHPAPQSAVGPFDGTVIQRAQAAYYGLVNHIDDCIAHVLECWREYKNPRTGDPLYVIFSSDHGEMMGDHHLFRKSLGYEASSHVPFFIHGYNVEMGGGPCDALCSWEDILPTVADMAGVDLPGAVDGRSLLPALRGGVPEQREWVFGMCEGQHTNYFLVRDRYKYLWFPKTGEEQVFDLIEDPRECNDLSGDAALRDPLREIMRAEVEKAGGVTYDPAALRPCENHVPKVFTS